MAKLLGIPLVIHEQNRVPGTTNRWLAKLAAGKILEAFPNSFPAASAPNVPATRYAGPSPPCRTSRYGRRNRAATCVFWYWAAAKAPKY